MQKVKNFPNYLIDESGLVLNKQYERELKGHLSTSTGYIYMTLRRDLVSHRVPLHRLLAFQFIPNPENKPMVNHRDGVKINNQLENLEWVTNQENVQHAYDLGINPKLEERWNNKNKINDIHHVCELLQEGLLGLKEISLITGVDPKSVGQIKYKNNWKDISNLYVW